MRIGEYCHVAQCRVCTIMYYARDTIWIWNMFFWSVCYQAMLFDRRSLTSVVPFYRPFLCKCMECVAVRYIVFEYEGRSAIPVWSR